MNDRDEGVRADPASDIAMLVLALISLFVLTFFVRPHRGAAMTGVEADHFSYPASREVRAGAPATGLGLEDPG